MSLVLDASLTLAWYFEDEATPAAEEVLDAVAEQGAIVPPLWRLEVANAFQSGVRRGRIDAAYRDASLGSGAPPHHDRRGGRRPSLDERSETLRPTWANDS